MNSEEYLDKRLVGQTEWYSKKSGINQRKYKNLQTINIILAVAIPILTLIITNEFYLKVVVSINGALIAIIESISRLNNYKELWVKYRMVAEALKREKFLFETQSSPYDSEKSFNLLVKRSENIMASENSYWNEIHKDQEPA